MLKKNYEGLDVAFVPITGADIITASACSIVSVQYYAKYEGSSECETETDEGFGEGYSYNWNRRATGE